LFQGKISCGEQPLCCYDTWWSSLSSKLEINRTVRVLHSRGGQQIEPLKCKLTVGKMESLTSLQSESFVKKVKTQWAILFLVHILIDANIGLTWLCIMIPLNLTRDLTSTLSTDNNRRHCTTDLFCE